MGYNKFIVNSAVSKNTLALSAVVKAANTLTQGDVVTFTEAGRIAASPANIAAAQAALYVVSNVDDAKFQFDTIEAADTFGAGEFVRLFEMRTLEGFDSVTLEAGIVDENSGTVIVGSNLIPIHTGGWQLNATLTGYTYYLTVQDILLNEAGEVYHCSLVVA